MAKIKKGFPPNIDRIREALPVPDGAIFAYDHTIYYPWGNSLPPELIAHEEVHFEQQDKFREDKRGGVEAWWEEYLTNVLFRYKMELEAHRVEHKVFCRFNRDRNVRARHLDTIAGRLSSAMYGGIVTKPEALKAIRRR